MTYRSASQLSPIDCFTLRILARKGKNAPTASFLELSKNDPSNLWTAWIITIFWQLPAGI
jgi:hypothetical protein